MNDILLVIIVALACVPLTVFVLRKHFGNSIMVSIGTFVSIMVLFDCVLFYCVGKWGVKHALWAVPSSGFLIFLIFELINKKIKKPLENSVLNIKQMSLGNLELTIDKDLLSKNDELGILTIGINDLIVKLNAILAEIQTTSSNIATASEQLNNASQEISSSANQQASSVEELSASMEEMASSIDQNTDHSKQTEQIALLSAQSIREVYTSSEKSLNAVKIITQKIGVINDIAFQTNILALNAAVEAARAGEQGRGFAVVAAEVRKLAERSKDAADQIVTLSQETLQLTEQSSVKLNAIVPEIEKTAKLIQEISRASQEQSNGAEQINSTIQQFNQVSQQNAASSEELAVSAEELASWAKQLEELITFFKTSAKG